ncbi:MAG: trehalase family glycosidase, partial [Armatimonadota bacterium]|nr:trehalase family glycosidase [Armatimonadota bacterium]
MKGNLPNIWGKGGALFAFSGFDGPTNCVHALVGSTSSEGRGIDFHTAIPASLIFHFSSICAIEDEVVASDVVSSLIITSGGRLRLRYLFIDKDTVVGEVFAEESQSSQDISIGIEMEGANLTYGATNISFRAGVEELILAGKAASLRINKDNLCASLAAGQSLKFALAYSYDMPAGSRLNDAEKALDVNLDKLFCDRVAFFEKLPAPQFEDEMLLRTYYKCVSVQKVNCCRAEGDIRYDWTTPDRWPHKYMWIWDSAFHAIGLRHFAPKWAINSIKAVLSKQKQDGFIPHMMTPNDEQDSNIIQPPILSWATWKVYETTRDEKFLQHCYPRLKAMLLYECRELDKDESGLCEWQSGGASGMDNSPRFDQPLGDAVDLNAYLVNDLAYLEKIARRLGIPNEAGIWADLRYSRIALINERLWNEEKGFYYDLTPDGRQLNLKTIAGFIPLFAGICNENQAEILVKHLKNPEEFWRKFPIPSVSFDEPSFSDDMWRGPTWVNLNYMIMEGLIRYGYLTLADEIKKKTLNEIARWY